MGKQKIINDMRNYTMKLEEQQELCEKQLAVAQELIKTQAELILSYEETVAVQKEFIEVLKGVECYDNECTVRIYDKSAIPSEEPFCSG